MLICKSLDPDAILPTVANPGEDLGFDLYALELTVLSPNSVQPVRTGISARFVDEVHFEMYGEQFGLLYRDRSSMASKNITLSGGVIDAGYTGELKVLLTNHNNTAYIIQKGDKIAQMIPTPVRTSGVIQWVDELPESNRQTDGFGSSGR